MKIYRASLMSTKFEFEAYGAYASDAKTFLLRALNNHATQYDLDDRWLRHYEIEINEFDIGAGYRDRQMISTAPDFLSDPNSFKGAKGPNDN